MNQGFIDWSFLWIRKSFVTNFLCHVFFGHLAATCIETLIFNEQISSYRKAMNAKLSDFLVYSFIFILE